MTIIFISALGASTSNPFLTQYAINGMSYNSQINAFQLQTYYENRSGYNSVFISKVSLVNDGDTSELPTNA